MHHAVLAALPNVMGAAMSGQPQPNPKHERTTGGSAFYQIYETSDGRHLVLGAQEMKFVRNLLDRLGGRISWRCASGGRARIRRR